MKKILITTMCFFASLSLYSQAGGAAAPFLLIAPDARFAGMGESGTAIADDINAVYWNPGGLGFLKKTKLIGDIVTPYFEGSYSYSKWFPQVYTNKNDLFYYNITQGIYIKELNGLFAANFTYMDLGEFTRTMVNGEVAGKYNSNEFAFGLSYGTSIGEDIGIGWQLKYIQSNLSPASNFTIDKGGVAVSGAFDLGLLWNPGWGFNSVPFLHEKCFSAGFNLQNVGPKMTYSNESDPLPTTLRLGVALRLIDHKYNRLTFTTDAAKLLIRRSGLGSDPLPKSFETGWDNPGGMVWSTGIEYWYYRWVALRAGYFTEPALLGNRKFWTFGASVRIFFIQSDLSILKTVDENHPLANTVRLTFKVGG